MAKRHTAAGNNRSHILDAALGLFNASGSGPISTNHIAKAAGVSPGNLYYHFRNKEEIIYHLYQRMIDEFGTLWGSVLNSPDGFYALVDVLVNGFYANWRYRFLVREMPLLIQRDDELKTLYRHNARARMQLILAVFAKAYQKGQLTIDEDLLIADMSSIGWMINHFWIPFVDLERDTVTADDLRKGARLNLRLLEPYLSAETRNAMWQRFEVLAANTPALHERS